MTDLADRLLGWLLPATITTFLVLYVMSIRSGSEPEIALLWAGGAGATLAVLGRLAVTVVAIERQRVGPIDVTASSTTTQTPDDDATPSRSEPMTDIRSGEQQQEAVGV